jgi:hypothetical protein
LPSQTISPGGKNVNYPEFPEDSSTQQILPPETYPSTAIQMPVLAVFLNPTQQAESLKPSKYPLAENLLK